MTRLLSTGANGAPAREHGPARRPPLKDAAAATDYDVPHDATVVLPKASPALND
jgi:hypothetical protein